MNRVRRFLGTVCDGCRLCRYARENPQTPLWKDHGVGIGKWCPAWKAREEMERDRRGEPR